LKACYPRFGSLFKVLIVSRINRPLRLPYFIKGFIARCGAPIEFIVCELFQDAPAPASFSRPLIWHTDTLKRSKSDCVV